LMSTGSPTASTRRISFRQLARNSVTEMSMCKSYMGIWRTASGIEQGELARPLPRGGSVKLAGEGGIMRGEGRLSIEGRERARHRFRSAGRRGRRRSARLRCMRGTGSRR
jgi:hypothetical protein